MFTITGSEGRGRIAVWCQFLDNLSKDDDAGFFESVHAMKYFDVEESVGCCMDVILWVIPDFLRDHAWEDTGVLVIFHGGAEVEVLMSMPI